MPSLLQHPFSYSEDGWPYSFCRYLVFSRSMVSIDGFRHHVFGPDFFLAAPALFLPCVLSPHLLVTPLSRGRLFGTLLL